MMMQIIELPSHPYFVGVQFHPEFKSRPGKPSAVFLGKMPNLETYTTVRSNVCFTLSQPRRSLSDFLLSAYFKSVISTTVYKLACYVSEVRSV